nr:hypothetical protein Iba_chr15aCG13930 [Ipomoea batatas]
MIAPASSFFSGLLWTMITARRKSVAARDDGNGEEKLRRDQRLQGDFSEISRFLYKDRSVRRMSVATGDDSNGEEKLRRDQRLKGNVISSSVAAGDDGNSKEKLNSEVIKGSKFIKAETLKALVLHFLG